MPIVVGALGSVPLDLTRWLKCLDFDDSLIPVLQKTALLGTVSILRLFRCYLLIIYLYIPIPWLGVGILYQF